MHQKSSAFVVMLSTAFVSGLLAAVFAQAPAKPSAPARTVAAAKTPWGDPDISGVWTSDAAIGIPMQRPDQFGGRAELNEEEFAAKLKRGRDRRASGRKTRSASFRNDNAWLAQVVPPDVADRRSAGRQDARRHAARPETPARDARPRHLRRRSVRQDRKTSRTTTAASRAASSDRCCRSSTATATGSCRRRDRWSSATRWCTTRASSTPTAARTSARTSASTLGDSRGHWEGNTLVVETTNLTDQTSIGLNGNGLRHSDAT